MDYLLGETEREKIYVLHPAVWYADHGIDLRIGTSITRIDHAAHEVTGSSQLRV
jgi:3-phenylpropionate/trans-cinnamate dioxygenase ferredoxin reductase component